MAIKATPHSLNLQHYWNPIIRLFSVVSRTLVMGSYPFTRDAVGVFCSHSRLGFHRRSFTPLERCSRCILKPKPLLGSNPSAEMQSIYFTASVDWATGDSLGEFLPLCRDAIDIFYNPSRLCHRKLIGGVLPLSRYAIGVFCSHSRQGHKTLIWEVLPLCRDEVSVFYGPSQLCNRRLIGGVLPLCRDAIGVFYSHSRLGKQEKLFTKLSTKLKIRGTHWGSNSLTMTCLSGLLTIPGDEVFSKSARVTLTRSIRESGETKLNMQEVINNMYTS